MEKDKNNKSKKKLKIIYQFYHFIAKILLYSIFVILALVALMFILYFVDLEKNIKNGVDKQPLFGAYIIISPSMVPTIKVEDAIIIQRKEKEELEIGDIVTFLSTDPRYSGITITHRIVGKEKSKDGKVYFRTKGDNNNTEDAALVPYDNIYGKVILKIPKIGYIQQILTNFYGWVFLILIPCLGIIIYDIVKILKSLFVTVRTKTKKEQSKQEEYIEVIETKEEIEKKDNNDIDII